MFSAETDNDMVFCPYNSAHRIRRKRLQPHLLKCRQNYPDIELRKCPFNTTHLIPEPEFSLHVTNCSDRKLITQYKYDAPAPKEEERVKQAPIECEENWDDTEVEDYNPLKHLEQKKVILKPYGIPMAERKAFIKKERKRLGDGSSSSSEESDDNNIRSVKIVIKEEDSALDENGTPKKRDISKSPESWTRSRSRSRSRSCEPQRNSQYSEYYRRTHREQEERLSQSFQRRNCSQPFHSSNLKNLPSKRDLAREYNLDDDPYYNRGSQHRTRDEQYNSNFAGQNPGPSRSYGRGSHRGYPYDRRSGPSSRFNNC